MQDELAIRGGPAAVPDGLKRRWPDIRPEDKVAVLAVLDRGELTGINGLEATSLEREWADRLGVAHAVLFNTGTAAIHSALYAVGVQAGDEVITTAFTFSGTFQAILHQAAIPVFVDVHPRTYNIDPDLIEARITPRTFVGEVVMKQTITPLLAAAKARGCQIQVGTDMLFEMIPAYLEFFGFGTSTPEELRAVAKVAYL